MILAQRYRVALALRLESSGFLLGAVRMYKNIFLRENAFICKFTIRPERRDEFLRVLNALWKSFVDVMERDTNFMYYGWGRDPNELFIIESWKDERATNAVRAELRFKKAVAELLDCCSAPMTMQLLSGLDGDRSIFDQYPAGPSAHHPTSESVASRFL
jgi:quinol monooxygenase YgiN